MRRGSSSGTRCAPPASAGRSRGQRATRGAAARREGAARRGAGPARGTAPAIAGSAHAGRVRGGNRRASAPRCSGAAGAAKRSAVGAVSTMRPAYITATRSQNSATTPRSCVMSSTAMPSSRAQAVDEVEDLRLHGDVERGRRLVGDEQLRIAGERHGDHHALALAAGELVRIAVERPAAGSGCRRGSRSSTARPRASRRGRRGGAAAPPRRSGRRR